MKVVKQLKLNPIYWNVGLLSKDINWSYLDDLICHKLTSREYRNTLFDFPDVNDLTYRVHDL